MKDIEIVPDMSKPNTETCKCRCSYCVVRGEHADHKCGCTIGLRDKKVRTKKENTNEQNASSRLYQFTIRTQDN